ncbi:MAG: cytochrome c biogenesis protein CcmE, partial [Oleibacter sp.]|nr:cytochrome c biogenesis protein CcmE [Thalassolituus sp.]
MTPKRKKRLILILFLVAGVGTAVGLLMYSLSQNINLFMTPTQIADGEVPVGRTIRAGGLVVVGSLQRSQDSLVSEFKVTDGNAEVTITY